jgi:ADP-ribose diphosphatase
VIHPWRTLARRVLLRRPPWFEVGEEDVELPDGKVIEGFSWIKMREFAIVVPITADDRTILMRSYKHGVRAVSLSLPAGYIEDGEEPLAAARRELLEETGNVADEWIPLGRYVIDGNYGSGAMHAFLARGARQVQAPDSGDHEEQELLVMPFDEAIDRLARGEVAQLSTAGALGLACLARERERA